MQVADSESRANRISEVVQSIDACIKQNEKKNGWGKCDRFFDGIFAVFSFSLLSVTISAATKIFNYNTILQNWKTEREVTLLKSSQENEAKQNQRTKASSIISPSIGPNFACVNAIFIAVILRDDYRACKNRFRPARPISML